MSTTTETKEFSVRDCLQFVERYRADGYIPPAKAKGWIAALKALSLGDEDQDVREMDFKALVVRSITKGTTPETATAYGQRSERCRMTFVAYKKDPRAFKPMEKRSSPKRNGNGEVKALKPDSQLSVFNNGGEQTLEVTFGPTRVRVVVIGKVELNRDHVEFVSRWLEDVAERALKDAQG